MLRFYFLFVPALFVWFSGTSKPVSEVFLASSEPAHDRYTTNLAPCDPIADSLQLVQLFNATGGFDWTQPWDLTQPMTTWTGVILNVEYCVGVVNLSNNNLSGNIPDLQLPNCTVLNLEGNHLEGTIPNFTGLPGLQLLILNNNNLEGNIPDFTSVVQLIQFSASENNLFGSVPSFTNTPKLKTYELAHNKIIGILPNFQNLPLLQLFNASYNNITGNVPNFLNLQNLKYLILNHNKLEGSIPNFFLLNELRELDLSFNKLTGPIPNFVNLRKMTSMQLNNNLLSGTIPNFAQLDSITERIWLQSNQLSGLVPNFTKLNRLIELNLDDNVLDSLPIQEYLDSLLTLKIRLNGFTFDDLIPNKDVAPYMFNYPQDSVGTGGIVDLQIGQTYTIHLGIDPSLFNSLYRWYKNGVLQQITTSNSYTISNAYPADAGVYMCFISNSDLPQVTLFSKQFFVRVNFNNSQYNDDCQNAITILELNGHCNEYTMTGATPDLFSGSCAVGQNNVWFRFVAEGPNIFITGTAENGSNIEMAIIEFPEESCDPNTAIELFCALGVLNKTNLLVQGKVYYLVVSSDLNGEGPFELCVSNPNVPPPPPNDAICNALAISPNGHCRLSKTISASIDFGNDQCPALSQQSVWFKTTLSAKKNRLKIDLLTNTFVSDVSIMVCTLNPDCNSTPTVVTNGRYCGSPDNIFIVNGLQSGIQYYIQISTTKQGAGVFEMCLYEEGDPLNCAENQNCNDGVNGPALIATVTGAGKVCLNGCNTGAKIALNIGNANCFAFTNPTVWYRVLTDATADLLSIDLASGDFDQPQIAILTSSNCAAFAPIACNIGVNGQVKLENVKVSPNSWYLIAVTESGGGTGSFTICAETKADSPNCNLSDLLEVTNTSLGSPHTGPFKPGEVVTFCYRITQWQKDACNWLQGIVPSFGNGWDSISYKPTGEPKFIINGLDNNINGYWSWYIRDEVHYNVSNPDMGLNAGQNLPGGWYFINPSTLPFSGIAFPDSSWGDGYLCPPKFDSLTWEVCFAMVARGPGSCLTANDCSVSIKTYSDGEIGTKPEVSCLGNQATWFNSYVNCCLEPIMDSIPDITLCSGTQLVQQLKSSLDPITQYNWIISNIKDVVGPEAGTGNLIDQPIVNIGSNPGFVEYTVFARAGDCSTFPQTFRVSVPAAPTASLSGGLTTCSGDTTFIIFNFTGQAPYRFVLKANGVAMDTFTAGTKVYNHLVHPTVSTTYTIGYFEDAACGGTFSGTSFIFVKPNGVVLADTSFCYGGSIILFGNTIDATGSFDFDLGFDSQNGCDSVLRYDVTELDSIAIASAEIETDSGFANGSVHLFMEGGNGPYTYHWENGAITSFLVGIKGGIYRVTVTDEQGCTNKFSILIPFSSDVKNVDEDWMNGISPNPVKAGSPFVIRLNENIPRKLRVNIFDAIGRNLQSRIIETQSGLFSYTMHAPSEPGIYSIVIQEGKARLRSYKLVVF